MKYCKNNVNQLRKAREKDVHTGILKSCKTEVADSDAEKCRIMSAGLQAFPIVLTKSCLSAKSRPVKIQGYTDTILNHLYPSDYVHSMDLKRFSSHG